MFKKIAKEEGKYFEALSLGAKNKLLSYNWPGNVRQLENTIRNTIVMNDSEVIEADMFPNFPSDKTQTVNLDSNEGLQPELSSVSLASVSVDGQANKASRHTLKSHLDIQPMWIVEKDYIEQAIEVCGNNIPKAAAMLDLSPSTIYRKMKAWEQ